MAHKNPFDQRGEFIRFSILDEPTIPGTGLRVPDLIVKSYWESFDVKMTEKITRKKTMGGWAEDHWPADLDTISVNGATGAFILFGEPTQKNFQADPGNPGQVERNSPDFGLATGNQVFMRRLTEASRNLEDIAQLYKINGATYAQDGRVAELRDIEMVYLGDSYIGYFTDFNFNHSDQSPNMFTYSFTFRVKQTYLDSRFPQSEGTIVGV